MKADAGNLLNLVLPARRLAGTREIGVLTVRGLTWILWLQLSVSSVYCTGNPSYGEQSLWGIRRRCDGRYADRQHVYFPPLFLFLHHFVIISQDPDTALRSTGAWWVASRAYLAGGHLWG